MSAVLSVVAVVALVSALRAPAAAYDVTSVTDGGALAGVVRFVGVAAEPPPSRGNAPGDGCRGREDAEALVLGAGRGVRDSVILLEGVERGQEPAPAAVLDTSRCAFVSHVTVVVTGERTRVRNDDAILHNPQGFRGMPAVFNLALPGREQTIDITRWLVRPGVIRVTMWHEGFRARGRDAAGRPRYDASRTLRKDVTIGPAETAAMDFELR